MFDLREILERASELEASVVHLQTGEEPALRVRDQLVRLEMPEVADVDLVGAARGLLSDAQFREYEERDDVRFLYRDGKISYKASFFRVVDGHGLVLKRIFTSYPTLEELGLPSYLVDFFWMRSGLVLLTGPIGCGKTTTQTALLHRLNVERDLHVLVVESSLEFVLEDGQSLIQQCEVGRHVGSMREGIELARQVRPDLTVVSDLMDRDTVQEIVRAADSGMLVVASLHAGSVTQALAKLEDLFLPRERPSFRRRLSEVLRVVVCQVLVHKQYGAGVLPVLEVLTNTDEVRSVLVTGNYSALRRVMEKNRGLGMCSLDDALYEMVVHNKVLLDEAVVYAIDKERFEACRRLPQLTTPT